MQSEIKRDETTNLHRLSYALWLGTGLRKPRPEAMEALAARLATVNASTDRAVQLRIRRAVARCGPAAAAIVPHIVALLERLELGMVLADDLNGWAKTLGRLGPPGIAALCRLSDDFPPEAPYRALSYNELVDEFILICGNAAPVDAIVSLLEHAKQEFALG